MIVFMRKLDIIKQIESIQVKLEKDIERYNLIGRETALIFSELSEIIGKSNPRLIVKLILQLMKLEEHMAILSIREIELELLVAKASSAVF